MRLDTLNSVINGYPYAKDRDRAFTFIEFIKEFGGDNTDAEFLTSYKDYLNLWMNRKSGEITLTKDEFVRQKMIDILKTITVNYASYEEQQFLASIDWTNQDQIKTTIPLYVRKIREVCEFYRKQRNDIPLVVKRNSTKGSYQSVVEIIYNKIIDFAFNTKQLQPQMAELKKNLTVSIEQFVDTYSEYFDVPREKAYRIEKEREYMIECNMNEVDYRDYLDINEILKETLYTGEVYLIELGLMADLALDLTQDCVGEMLELKNQLLYEATINQVSLTDQINIRRRFYEKFIGCDLWYMFVDQMGNITMDVFCKAANPSGNLLNCGNPDRAVTQGQAIELLTHVGLFFKPDKTSILKINAKERSWSIDENKLSAGSVYVFPDPTKYGNIGNNKNLDYPLIMTYKMNYDIRNLSSGLAQADPLILLDEQAWQSYYSKQQDIFKTLNNKDFDYSFTSLANEGFIQNYQTDIYSNEFAIFKGYKEVYRADGALDHIEVPNKFLTQSITQVDAREENQFQIFQPILLNGGYFEDPEHPGHYEVDSNGNKKYIPGKPFNFKQKSSNNSSINRTSLQLGKAPIITPQKIFPWVKLKNFGNSKNVKFIDNFHPINSSGNITSDAEHQNESINLINDTRSEFFSQLDFGSHKKVPIQGVDMSFIDIQNDDGVLFIRNNSSIKNRPITLADTMPWLPENLRTKKVINIHVKKNTLIYETKNEIVFVPYLYEDGKIIDNTGLHELFVLSKTNILLSDLIWNEKTQKFIIVIFNKYISSKATLIPSIYQFDPIEYTFTMVVSAWQFIPAVETKLHEIEKSYFFDNDRFPAVQSYLQSLASSANTDLDDVCCSSSYNFENFNFTNQDNIDFGHIVLSYNNNLDTYLVAYLINDSNGAPNLYEHKFRITTKEMFNKTLTSTLYSLR